MKSLFTAFALALSVTAHADPKGSYFFCFNSTGISDAPANILVMAQVTQGMAAGMFNAGNSEPPRAIFSFAVSKPVAVDQQSYGPVWKSNTGPVIYGAHTSPGVFPDFKEGTMYFDHTGRADYEGNLDYVELKTVSKTVTYNNCKESKN